MRSALPTLIDPGVSSRLRLKRYLSWEFYQTVSDRCYRYLTGTIVLVSGFSEIREQTSRKPVGYITLNPAEPLGVNVHFSIISAVTPGLFSFSRSHDLSSSMRSMAMARSRVAPSFAGLVNLPAAVNSPLSARPYNAPLKS